MSNSNEETRVNQTFYENGNLKSEVTYVGDHWEGTRTWYENGVLKQEIPMRRSMIHGTVRKWDMRGNLLGEDVFVDGTGVVRIWYDNGQLKSELSVRHGAPCGIHRVWLENGELVNEDYYLMGRKVSRKKYLAAQQKDPALPKCDEAPKAAKKRPPESRRTVETPPIALADYDDACEALEWLGESSDAANRTLGELPSTKHSLELVREFLEAGAKNVYVVRIETDDDGSLNSGHLLIVLPSNKKARSSALDFCNEMNIQQGFDPLSDIGQEFVEVSLD